MTNPAYEATNSDVEKLKPGKYAILYRDNWDGEGDTYHTLANLEPDGRWLSDETGKELLEYEGDEILKAWPLDDGADVLQSTPNGMMQLPAAQIKWDGSQFSVQNVRDGFSYGVTDVYTQPVGFGQLSNELAEMKRKCAELPDEFARIGENLRTQDNRITSHPVFVVFQKEEMVVSEEFDHDRIAWVWECGDGEVEDRTARRLEALHKGCRDTRGYSRYAMKSINRFVTAFFTEDGCKDYLRQNGHNLNEPFIYVHSAYRNDEWRVIRNWLMTVGGTVEGSE